MYIWGGRSALIYLHKHGEQNDHDGGSNEKSFFGEIVNEEDQRETDCPSQATIGNDELVTEGHSVAAKFVDHSCEEEYAWRGKNIISLLTLYKAVFYLD